MPGIRRNQTMAGTPLRPSALDVLQAAAAAREPVGGTVRRSHTFAGKVDEAGYSQVAAALSWHSTDTDTDTDVLVDIVARIVAKMSACRSACHRNNFNRACRTLSLIHI